MCNAFYGTRLILDNEEPVVAEYRKRIEGVDIQVTQGVSQASTALSVPLPDDLLQTPKMSIEDLIEATELCDGVVLATICGIESEYSWYYEACTKCAGRVNIIAGRMYCPKCKQGRNAVPRYKVHLQAIDPTGSTSFILFDRNVHKYVGRSVHDLIERHNQGNNNTDYPRELDVFLGKTMLFKVEVTQGNLLHSWRNYSVKRSSDDIDLIKRFKILHNIKDEDADIDDNVLCLSDVAPNETLLLEAGDSTKSEKILKESNDTPCSKVNGKRGADNMPHGPTFDTEDGEGSANRARPKAACIKTEKD